ncbi:MAG: beta-galactosidase [Candidatus Zixiibacteriota bacterium]
MHGRFIRYFAKVLGGFLVAVLALTTAAYLLFGRGGEAEEIKWGVAFDPYYAEYLGLDWQKTYLSLLDEVGIDHLRLAAFWDATEPEDDQLDFERLDLQVKEAEKRGVKLILAIGRRLPRWPECHEPQWARDQKSNIKNQKILEYLEPVVNRYKDSPSLEFWQVENEPYVWFFGECPGADEQFIKQEMDLVKSLDPSHPIMLTESGELSLWFKISHLADYVGVSMYRVVYDNIFHRYQPSLFPSWSYRIKANILRRLGWVKELFVVELQAEPWGPKPLVEMTLEEQYRSFNPDRFRHNLRFARSTGFSRFYLWGAEWWFYAKEKLGVPDFIEIAKELW